MLAAVERWVEMFEGDRHGGFHENHPPARHVCLYHSGLREATSLLSRTSRPLRGSGDRVEEANADLVLNLPRAVLARRVV